jgi:tripartite-type tricarboxylate transporter receptor subunit TctC
MLVNNPAAVSVRADAPWQTLQDLVNDVRANPGRYQASGTSRGGIWDLARIGMLQAADLPESALPWVPSQGASPAFQELLAGGVQVVTAALAEAEALLSAGQVRVLGVMADERLEGFPNVPTLREQGVAWSLGGWVGVGAPAGLSDTVRVVLSEAIREAAHDPAYTEPMRQAGFHLEYLDAEAFAAFMRAQDQTNGALLRAAGIAR